MVDHESARCGERHRLVARRELHLDVRRLGRQSASFDMYQFVNNGWNRIWQKTTTTSCASTTFSADSSQVISAMYWYQADGATARATYGHRQPGRPFSGPRPADAPLETTTSAASCTAWRGAQTPITSLRHTVATTRVYYWFANIDEDNDGYNTTDQGDGIVDAFPSDGHSGTTPTPTAMVITLLQPTNPMLVRPHLAPQQKTASAVPTPTVTAGPTQAIGTHSIPTSGWMQTRTGTATTTCLTLTNISITNQTGDAFPNDPTQWNDTDGDGYGDNYENASWNTYRPPTWPGLLLPAANMPDAFPLDRTQYVDTDGDWVGDNQNSDRPDACPNQWGDSQYDRLGCPDSDGDGYSNPTANWPSTPIVTVPMPSLTNQPNGATKTVMATAEPDGTNPMTAPTAQALPP